MKQLPAGIRGFRLAWEAERAGLGSQELQRLLTTGRLNIDTEWAIKTMLRSDTMNDAYRELADGRRWLDCIGGEDVNSLIQKRWLTKSDMTRGKAIIKSVIQKRWKC